MTTGRRGRPRKPIPPPPPEIPKDERRFNLRRLDDVLEALEVLNLVDARRVPKAVATRLAELGIEHAEATTATDLIERVWKLQEPFLQPMDIDRRTRRRRSVAPQVEGWLAEPD